MKRTCCDCAGQSALCAECEALRAWVELLREDQPARLIPHQYPRPHNDGKAASE